MVHALPLPLAVEQPSTSIPALASGALSTLWGRPVAVEDKEWTRRELGQEELYARICVRDPYFALREVTMVGPGAVLARVPVEQEPGAEASPLSAGEVGRHLACLGACAASLVNPKQGQHYYLVRRARLERLHPGPLPQASGGLWGSAWAEFTEKRTATAHTLLASNEGQPLFSLKVDYHVLPAMVFLRLFQEARVDMRRESRDEGGPGRLTPGDLNALRRNPHCEPPPLRDVLRDGECLRATLGPVSAEWCLGHFAMHPVLPVAAVMSGLSRLAGTLLRQLVGDPSARYLVARGEVRTDSLTHAGETVTFGVHLHGVEGLDHRFYCWASAGERLVGVMDLTLTWVK